MANPSVSNVNGTNTGPNVATLPDTVQLPVGNIWKSGLFNVTLSPASVQPSTAVEQTFASTGIGLLVGDFVSVTKPTTQTGLVIGNARVSAADTLAVDFGNASAATVSPTAAESYQVLVVRQQPNWTAPASGNQFDW